MRLSNYLTAAVAVLVATLATVTMGENSVFSYYYWQADGIQPWEQPGNAVTHVIFSFANILRDGTVTLQGPPNTAAGRTALAMATTQQYGNSDTTKCNCEGGCLKGQLWQFFLLKQKYPHLKTLLSIGGWVWSDNFSAAFSNQNSRANAIKTTANLLTTYGFDGLDIDWEFPTSAKADFPNWTTSPNDVTYLLNFFTEARAYFNGNNMKDALLTMAGTSYLFAPGPWEAVGGALDYFLVMAYEFHHGQPRTYSGAALKAASTDSAGEQKSNVDYGLTTYVTAKIPKSKIVMGIPFYGVGWSGLPSNAAARDGIPGLGIAVKDSQIMPPQGYNALMRQFSTDKSWSAKYDDKRATNVWFNGSAVWFMESPQSIAAKAKYVADNGYAGVMFWNSNQDTTDTATSLITAVAAAYPVNTKNGRATPFCLTPPSDGKLQWCNLACGYTALANSTNSGNKGSGNTGGPGALVPSIPAGSQNAGGFGTSAAVMSSGSAWVSAVVALVAAAAVLALH
ncbi:glycosyl hydrolases family 18-domain-containing protein [Blastocladiella britannica]|nr:glycosyl hydrolases family 18-domain-containing protein [Blastocladiella britannica]